MHSSWFHSKKELDEDQKDFIKLPTKGRYLLKGPPGSGKTNLLLLRAKFFAGTGEKNVLIVTYTKTLAEFIRGGMDSSDLIQASQVRTFHSWAYDHILQNTGKFALGINSDFDEDTRSDLLKQLKEVNGKLKSKKIYSAIFVDEAQDLTAEELEELLILSDNVCICGDDRQGIYFRDGLSVAEKLNLDEHTLKQHFRIGHRIAHVADRLQPPDEGAQLLEATSNYNKKLYGESTANLHPSESRDEQFARMLEILEDEVDAFKDDTIGIFCGKKESVVDLRKRFDNTKFASMVNVYGVDKDAGFKDGKVIHVMTMHSSKGTEFRAVHLFGVEELAKHPFRRTRLAYTAVTRARTALNAYRLGNTSAALDNAFAVSSDYSFDDLLPD